MRKPGPPDTDARAWPAGLDRGILVGLPLRDGARRSLLRAGLTAGYDALTVYELVRTPSCNPRSMPKRSWLPTHF